MKRLVLISGCVVGLAAAVFGQAVPGGEGMMGTLVTESRPAGTMAATAGGAGGAATGAARGAASAAATEEGKDYVHPGTKIVFPESVVEFGRGEVTKFKEDETDVGVGYNFEERWLPIVATVYIFPVPTVRRAAGETDEALKARQSQRALETVKAEIAGYHRDAKVMAEGEYVLKEGERSHKGVKVTYEMGFNFSGQTVAAQSDMFLFVEGAWQIEYRLSYRKAQAVLARPYVEKLMGALRWRSKE
jgi:hypothetical protein